MLPSHNSVLASSQLAILSIPHAHHAHNKQFSHWAHNPNKHHIPLLWATHHIYHRVDHDLPIDQYQHNTKHHSSVPSNVPGDML
jgi:hypothetical protein